MNSFVLKVNLRAEHIGMTADELVVNLKDDWRLSISLAWFPRLLHASDAQREHWELPGDGEGIHWTDLDEDVSVAGLLRGRRAV